MPAPLRQEEVKLIREELEPMVSVAEVSAVGVSVGVVFQVVEAVLEEADRQEAGKKEIYR